MVVALSVLLVISLILIYVELKRISFHKRHANITGPKEFPVIGNVNLLKLKTKMNLEDVLKHLFSASTIKFTSFGRGFIGSYDPDIAHQLLVSSKCLERPFVFDYFEYKDSLISAKYTVWTKLRKMMNPSFSPKAIQMMNPISNQHIDSLMEHLKQYNCDEEFDIHPILLKRFIQQLVDTLFDAKIDVSLSDIALIDQLSEIVCQRFMNPLYHFEILFQVSSLYKTLKKSKAKLNDIIGPILDEKLKISRNSPITSNTKILINDLIKTNLSKKVIFDNMALMLLAGFEPTVTTVANVLLMLAMHPHVDRILFEEIQKNYTPGAPLGNETLQSMSYLDMVIKETLRLFPAVPGTIKECFEDVYINKIGNVKKGTGIIIPTFLLHRDPAIWGSNAHKFDPDNFLPEKVAKRHSYSYIPFSTGPRNCIGMHYALQNIKLILVKVLSKHKFTTSLQYKDITTRFCIALKIHQQHLVCIHPRDSKK